MQIRQTLHNSFYMCVRSCLYRYRSIFKLQREQKNEKEKQIGTEQHFVVFAFCYHHYQNIIIENVPTLSDDMYTRIFFVVENRI
jgi:hypothetical protein